MQFLIRFIFTISFYLCLIYSTNAQFISFDDSILVKQIRNSNLEYLEKLVQDKGVDAVFNDTHSLLALAIVENNIDVVKFLINKGASINTLTNNLSPLMHCAINDRPEIAGLLIKLGANVNFYNKHRNTALLYGSRYGNINTVRVLIQRRADPFFKNFMGYNSLDYALEYNKLDVAELLQQYMVRFAKGAFPSTFDGPHVEWLSYNKVNAFYMINDSIAGKIFVKRKTFKVKNSATIKGFIPEDTLSYKIYKPIKFDSKDIFHHSKPVFAVGDVHGSYDSLITLLIGNKIIDNKLNWTFADGHLIFIGDLLDRGDKVTELLWLVYTLTYQAPEFGGRVDVLLGNHEMLVLNKDLRYLNDKYSYITRGLNINYSDLFKSNTVLGNFVRNFKTAIIVDSVLFVHAGLTNYFVDQKISIPNLNKTVNDILNPSEDKIIKEPTFEIFSEINSYRGPIWYRGYLSESAIVPRATQAEIDKVLEYTGTYTMIVGHTEILNIEKLYNGKLIPINVPFDRAGIRKQGLLITNRKFYRCYTDGSMEVIL